jgi:hypothetical protein
MAPNKRKNRARKLALAHAPEVPVPITDPAPLETLVAAEKSYQGQFTPRHFNSELT